MKTPQRRYSPEEVDYLREIVPGHTISEVQALFAERFGVELTHGQIDGCKQRYHLYSGVDGRFKPGLVPHNKGRKASEYVSPEALARSRATQFKPGILPHNALPVGAERVTCDGYIEVHVAARVRERPNDNWVAKQRIIWEREHGEIPKGHVVVFCDGDRSNCAVDNLACISRADLALLNKSDVTYFDRDSLQVALDVVHLKRDAYKRQRDKRQGCKETRSDHGMR